MTHRNLYASIALVAGSASLGACGSPEAPEAPADRQAAEPIRSAVIGREGERIGELVVRSGQQGVSFDVRASGLDPGRHAIHVHQTASCQPPEFSGAGGHYDPAGARHGMPDGDADPDDAAHHAGDMPNHRVGRNGVLEASILNRSVTLRGENALLDRDGSAIVIHAEGDDYVSQPSGDAGRRVACAEISARNLAAD